MSIVSWVLFSLLRPALFMRTYSPWEMKDILDKLQEKNMDRLIIDPRIIRDQLKKEKFIAESAEGGKVRLVIDTEKPTTYYGPYYMYKGKVYSRKGYTKVPTPNISSNTKKYSYSRKYSYSFKPRTTTSYKNKSTFYGPYYMYKGTLFSRKHYTKFPTSPTTKGTGSTTSYSWKKGSWSKWSRTTIPWYNRTTIPWYNRTTSYGPFFVFKGKVISRMRYTAVSTEAGVPPWMKKKSTFRWTGEYPFGTRYYSRVPVPNYCKRRPVGVRVREDSDFEEQHDSNPSLFSDLEISNETYSDIAANKWIAEHDMDQFQDSEMYITLRPTIRQTYKHGFLWGKYPTVDWTNNYQNCDFLKDIQIQHHQEWTLEMLRFSFNPNHSTTPIVRPPWIPNSAVERYYM